MTKLTVYISQIICKEVKNYISKFCDHEKWESDKKITRIELLKKFDNKEED